MNKQREIAKLESELNSAIAAAVQSLNTASIAAHKLKDVEEEDDEQAHFDRLVDLGMVVDCAALLCSTNLQVLAQVMLAMNGHGADEIEPQQLQH